MSPRCFRKISHPEPKILNSLVNCTLTHRHTDAHTHRCKCRADPTRGGSAKNTEVIMMLSNQAYWVTQPTNQSLNTYSVRPVWTEVQIETIEKLIEFKFYLKLFFYRDPYMCLDYDFINKQCFAAMKIFLSAIILSTNTYTVRIFANISRYFLNLTY